MKQLLRFIAVILTVVSAFYLYSLQLGAIPFFLMSFFFFYLAVRILARDKKRQKEEGKY
ncbi:hypothetical protein [Robertmurraya korlensis]|uniref:hypothetical protein n=1 Tax=Robertmurraya korlensis TaxID=519977 RepID=UPI000B262E0D|nr:hypothetical protein [Robertmurraya korlensis]